jgi:ribulose 1,5-bisphosphate synthetase/thiazole synthase
MQHIGIVLQDEKGALLKDSGINFASVLAEVYKIDDQKKSSALLWMINPYGNTIFNSIQVPLVVSQLRDLNFSEENKVIAGNVINFLNVAGLHQYICFTGD